jgi:hypothetical protein
MEGYVGIKLWLYLFKQTAWYRRCNYGYLIAMHSGAGGSERKNESRGKLIKWKRKFMFI